MDSSVHDINEIKNIVGEIARRYGVERVCLFGSYARGQAKPGSDIDLRIDKGRIRGLFELSGFHLDLEEKLMTKVDVVTSEGLNEKFIKRIQKEKIVLYERQ